MSALIIALVAGIVVFMIGIAIEIMDSDFNPF